MAKAHKHLVDVDDELIHAVQSTFNDPYQFVLFAFPWGQKGTILEDEPGPDRWQAEFLLRLGQELKRRDPSADTDRERVETALRMCVRSGHGIGKGAMVAWLILWHSATRPHGQNVVTANTKTQLETKTWRELAKWWKLSIVKHWFQWTATKFYHREHHEDWFTAAVPWSKERSEAFAGTHDRYVMMIFDEASSIDDVIWDTAMGALTTSGAMLFAFGNPTRHTGRFRECWRKFRDRWVQFAVDSRKASHTNKAELAAWIKDYGEDSDFVRTRVYGKFPRTSATQLIGDDHIAAATRQPEPEEWETAARVIGVDVARFGDDLSVLYDRQGNKTHAMLVWHEVDTHQLAYHVIAYIQEHKPDAVFIEEVGIGVGVIDTMKAAGYETIGVIPQARAAEDRKHSNKRAEMWWELRDWLRDGGSILLEDQTEPDEKLVEDLLAPEYMFDGRGRIQLERKEDMKARGLPSPDRADALALTFYEPVVSKRTTESLVERWMRKHEMAQASRTSWMAR